MRLRRAIRELLASGLDPFTRFITPEDFLAMRKYDVTGVGLNLAPAEEYERKVGAPLPSGSPAEVRRHQPQRACFLGSCWDSYSCRTAQGASLPLVLSAHGH